MEKIIKFLLSFRKYRQWMVLGTKDFPVNPNDYFPWTEKDNPLLFSTYESADRFIKRCQEGNYEAKGDESQYFRIVEII